MRNEKRETRNFGSFFTRSVKKVSIIHHSLLFFYFNYSVILFISDNLKLILQRIGRDKFVGFGDIQHIAEIHRPDNAQEFPEKEELLTAMSEFRQKNKPPEEDARKFIRARWNEYYAHSRDNTDYYTIEQGYHFDSDGYYTREELTQPRYLALTFAEDGTLTDAVVTEEP